MADIRIGQLQEDSQNTKDLQVRQDPRRLARSVAEASADDPQEVGDFVEIIDLGDNVSDFRFVSRKVGYEGWQWAVTLYRDEAEERWTVNESSLVPTKDALLAPDWVPWKDRLLASDLSVTDVIGTDPNDKRMENGVRSKQPVPVVQADRSSAWTSQDHQSDESASLIDAEASGERSLSNKAEADETGSTVKPEGASEPLAVAEQDAAVDVDASANQVEATDVNAAVDEFDLSRCHVMSAIGREETAKRWYQGQHGPKSLSTKAADGNLCSSCAFFIGLKGQLGTMFGVCANRWSLDDGRVVSIDHGCGEHSEIEQPEPSHLWVQSDPAFDDLNIDVIKQSPREVRGPVELIEQSEDVEESEDNNGTEDVDNADGIENSAQLEASSELDAETETETESSLSSRSDG